MKILITGASGLLGGNLSFLYANQHEILATYFKNTVSIPYCKMQKLDLSIFQDCESFIMREKPALIIHCAANANVDDCETYPDKAYTANLTTTENLTRIAWNLGIKLIFISTDAMFTQNQSESFKETQTPDPKSVYATTKLRAEQTVLSLLPSAMVARTSIYGYNILPKTSMAEWALYELKKGKTVPGFTDVFFTPILVNDLANALELSIRNNLRGLFHIASRDSISKYDFLVKLSQKFNLPKHLIQPVSIAASSLKAYRPRKPCLNVSKFEMSTQKQLPSVQEGIDHFYQLEQSGFRNQLKMFNCNKESCANTSHASD